jgi:hypothetical protein
MRGTGVRAAPFHNAAFFPPSLVNSNKTPRRAYSLQHLRPVYHVPPRRREELLLRIGSSSSTRSSSGYLSRRYDGLNFDPTATLLENESPYTGVRFAVSNTGDPTIPSFTFRAWVVVSLTPFLSLVSISCSSLDILSLGYLQWSLKHFCLCWIGSLDRVVSQLPTFTV